MRERIALIIPCLNEARSIGQVLREIPPNSIDDLFVVDNGSVDGTGAIARAAGATVIIEVRQGYGHACYAGFLAAQAAGAEVLLFLDGDRSDSPSAIPEILAPLLSGEADLVLGRRLMEPGALPPQAFWGNRVALLLVRLLYKRHLADIPSFRAIRTASLGALGMVERTYGWPIEMIIRAIQRGYRIQEVGVPYRRRIGISKVSGTLRGTVLAGYRMFSTILRLASGTH